MDISSRYFHVVSYWVECDQPMVEWYTSMDEMQAFEFAAKCIKNCDPKGFTIVEREGTRVEVLEQYTPLGGGISRFGCTNENNVMYLTFDGEVIG